MSAAKRAYDAWRQIQAREGGALPPLWDELHDHEHRAWQEIAHAAQPPKPSDLDLSGIKERLPQVYLDAKILGSSTQIEQRGQTLELVLQLAVPAVVAQHPRPGPTIGMLKDILAAAVVPSGALRFYNVNDAQVRAELARVGPGGVLREFQPEEGTW